MRVNIHRHKCHRWTAGLNEAAVVDQHRADGHIPQGRRHRTDNKRSRAGRRCHQRCGEPVPADAGPETTDGQCSAAAGSGQTSTKLTINSGLGRWKRGSPASRETLKSEKTVLSRRGRCRQARGSRSHNSEQIRGLQQNLLRRFQDQMGRLGPISGEAKSRRRCHGVDAQHGSQIQPKDAQSTTTTSTRPRVRRRVSSRDCWGRAMAISGAATTASRQHTGPDKPEGPGQDLIENSSARTALTLNSSDSKPALRP